MIFIDFIKATMAQTGNAPEKFNYLAMKNSSAIYKNWRAKNPEKAWTISQYVEKVDKTFNVSFLPDNPIHVGLYILHKIQARHLLPIIDATFFVVKFYNTSLLNINPCKQSLVINISEAAKQLSHHTTQKKQALQPN